jgi:hypothetical protein
MPFEYAPYLGVERIELFLGRFLSDAVASHLGSMPLLQGKVYHEITHGLATL